MDHFFLLIWDALLISIFFTFLWREGAQARRIFFLKCFTSLALGSFVAGWLMYFLS